MAPGTRVCLKCAHLQSSAGADSEIWWVKVFAVAASLGVRFYALNNSFCTHLRQNGQQRVQNAPLHALPLFCAFKLFVRAEMNV